MIKSGDKGKQINKLMNVNDDISDVTGGFVDIKWEDESNWRIDDKYGDEMLIWRTSSGDRGNKDTAVHAKR